MSGTMRPDWPYLPVKKMRKKPYFSSLRYRSCRCDLMLSILYATQFKCLQFANFGSAAFASIRVQNAGTINACVA